MWHRSVPKHRADFVLRKCVTLGRLQPKCLVSGNSSTMLHNLFLCISLAFDCLYFVSGKWKREDTELSIGLMVTLCK